MTTLRLLPDIEALVGNALRNHDAIQALDARVGRRKPRTTTRPWIRVTKLDGIDRSGIEHLIAYLLQIDCFAGQDTATPAEEAQLLSASARAVLKALQGTVIEQVAIGRVRFTGDLPAPDNTMEPARERYVLTVEIVAHATI